MVGMDTGPETGFNKIENSSRKPSGPGPLALLFLLTLKQDK
jgi:hypothetical protein